MLGTNETIGAEGKVGRGETGSHRGMGVGSGAGRGTALRAAWSKGSAGLSPSTDADAVPPLLAGRAERVEHARHAAGPRWCGV